MECSILRIATYHKGLEGCDGFQNIFMICMRLLVKGEQISQPSAAVALTLSITHSPRTLRAEHTGSMGFRRRSKSPRYLPYHPLQHGTG